MSNDDSQLDARQQEKLLSVLRLGCSRRTACHFVGVSEASLHRAMQRDEAFAVELVRAEATIEVQHMAGVVSGAKDPKNWRISAWWLDKRDRQLVRDGETRSLAELVDALAESIVTVLDDQQLQRELLERLLNVVSGSIVAPQDEAPALSPPEDATE